MGRNFTPKAILDARGAFIKHPERARPNEPKSEHPLGAPPKYLSKEQKLIWKEISKRLLPGVALESDRDAFEMMVRLTAKQRGEEPMASAERATLISLWSRFAMTPADRAKVSVEKAPESALSKFMSRRQVPKEAEPSTDVLQ